MAYRGLVVQRNVLISPFWPDVPVVVNMTETIELEVSNEQVASEIGYALWGRSYDIYRNPDNEHEDVAEELADLSRELIEEYE